MIGPSKINNGGITLRLFAHTNREHGSTLAQVRKTSNVILFFFSTFLSQCQMPPSAAPEISALKQSGGA